MNGRIAVGTFLLALAIPTVAFADGYAVKCAPNEERVWLYDSTTTLNVAAKLKCGETVEVVGQESGYVKIRTAAGLEGYLPANNLPKLPVGVQGAPQAPAQDASPSFASLARAAVAARHPSNSSAASSPSAPGTAGNTAPAGAAQPVVAANVAPASQPRTAPAAVPAPVKAPAAAAISVTPVSSTTRTPAAPIPANSATAARTKTKSVAKPGTATVTTSAKPAPANPPAPRPAAASNAPLRTAMATPGPKAPSVQPVPAPAADIYVGGVVNASATPKAATVRTVSDTSDDDDDSYLTRPVSESDDPSCQTYFSGYGLSPGQFKWLADNRKKKYPSVCPAASPAMVDYVIIFTHDVDFFNYTMPTPIHTEAGGFSDWTPILEFDTSVISHSDIDKSRREYVWVFHFKRGAFDPAKFSPHRKFQYNKVESKYSRTVEDAFDFIQGQGLSQ